LTTPPPAEYLCGKRPFDALPTRDFERTAQRASKLRSPQLQQNEKMTTDTSRRDAAALLYDILEFERELKKTREFNVDFFPIAAYAFLKRIVVAGQVVPGLPRLAQREDSSASWESTTFSDQKTRQAKDAIELIEQFGDRGGRWSEHDALDRKIINALADQYNHRNEGITNSAAVGRLVRRSHTTIDDRKAAWCRRVLSKLRQEWPSWFGQPYSKYIAEAKKAGATNQVEIARHLTERGITTPRGKDRWHAKQVARLEAA
jgi:hypothetical protein